MKFVYYLACIGNPSIENKINILNKNLFYIHNNIKCDFDIIINLYDPYCYQVLDNLLSSLSFIKNVHFHTKRGILTEVFLTNPHNDILKQYQYILFILDDILISKLDINYMIKLKKKYDLEIISPKIINSTHKKWYDLSGNILTKNNFLEVYCLLMSPFDIEKFFSMHSIDNKWMWGADILFGYFKVKAGIYYNNVAIHALPSDSNRRDAWNDMQKYFKKLSIDYKEISKKYRCIKEKIILDPE